MKHYSAKQFAGKRVVILTVLALVLSGCSTYGSSFSCGDARGATCLPMDKIDLLITNGAIETYTKTSEQSKCRGAMCSRTTRLPGAKLLQDIEGIEIVESGDKSAAEVEIIENGDSNVSY